VLHNFSVTDGAGPQGGLTRGRDGNFYGTTYAGGARGTGTIFKITPDGALTTLYSFNNADDGSYPLSSPVEGDDGYFYGVASYSYNQKRSVVYQISSSGAYRPLYRFDGKSGLLGSSLIAGADGNLYGTTLQGAANHQYGTVFRITRSGRFTTLYKFDNTHGALPYSLIQGRDGHLYGTTYGGGKRLGVVYRLTVQGRLTLLHSFTGADGANPVASVVQGSDGNLYGATKYGGSKRRGVLYRISPAGTNFKVLHHFDFVNGRSPVATPIQHTNGSFYGDTYQGGSRDSGVFYSLNAGLQPYVEVQPASARVGTPVGIVGQDFTDATAVSFNGISAKFTVVSDTYLTATVPLRATTGVIKVVMSDHALKSARKFKVKR
jgi:uncharacterized repeat protein (TIGR03803 family)